jgi:predicted O-linked N-acetylglucosamine transferase (SPINDLY family)
MTQPTRNDPCPCGSGKKYKHCCERKSLPQTGQTRPNTALIPDALHLRGLTEHQQGNSAKAIELIGQAIQARPSEARYYLDLGKLHQDLDQLDAAVASYRKALFFKPAIAQAFDTAQQMLLRNHEAAQEHNIQGNALRIQGHLEEAISCYRNALLLKPYNADAYDTYLFTLQYSSTCPPAEIYAEHQRFAERFEAPLKPLWQPHPNPPEPERRLKVGYVSGDFRQHAVAYFIEPILASHDKAAVEVYGYCNNTVHDRYTERIASHTDHWLVCRGLSDEQLAQRIRSDGIDILVDLSGHTALNRLLVFARKPAPVQVTWIGYQGSTGLSAIDYRITDAFMDPPGQTERYHSETLVRLPNGGFAYQPEPDCPPVNALPALSSGELVFASLNTLSKINPAVVSLWARILQALPQARLMLGNVTDAEIAQRLASQFAQNGIAPERLILKPQMSTADYLALHQRIDIGLDPFPYNGGTTTMHSLWMGVPVITLAGQYAISRFGVSLMSRVGLAGFICQSKDDYVQCAIRLANDLPALDQVRQSLRQRMSAPEWAPASITRHLETAYREMWRKWCSL